MRLRPIYFISRSTVSSLENSRHSFLVETDTARWDIGKFRKFLWGSEFNVLSNCSRMKKFFEFESNVAHMEHRWRSELLQYQFLNMAPASKDDVGV